MHRKKMVKTLMSYRFNSLSKIAYEYDISGKTC